MAMASQWRDNCTASSYSPREQESKSNKQLGVGGKSKSVQRCRGDGNDTIGLGNNSRSMFASSGDSNCNTQQNYKRSNFQPAAMTVLETACNGNRAAKQ